MDRVGWTVERPTTRTGAENETWSICTGKQRPWACNWCRMLKRFAKGTPKSEATDEISLENATTKNQQVAGRFPERRLTESWPGFFIRPQSTHKYPTGFLVLLSPFISAFSAALPVKSTLLL